MPLAQDIGRPAPPLDLADDHGQQVSLANLRGSPVLVSFLSHAA